MKTAIFVILTIAALGAAGVMTAIIDSATTVYATAFVFPGPDNRDHLENPSFPFGLTVPPGPASPFHK
jgi:hypothetical protein